MKGGGTNANVFLTLYGDNGDSGERKLAKSETHMDKFEREQVQNLSLSFDFKVSKVSQLSSVTRKLIKLRNDYLFSEFIAVIHFHDKLVPMQQSLEQRACFLGRSVYFR